MHSPDLTTATNETDYLTDINHLKSEAILDLEELLTFSKELLSHARFNRYIKSKTVFRYNTFSAMYQRADAVLTLTQSNQGNVANIIVRSMWETLAEYDFVNLSPSNLNLEIRLANESKMQLSTWSEVQSLRSKFPNANTWQETISDQAITNTILRRRNELSKFALTHPNINLDSYRSFVARLKKIDETNLSKNPNFKTLTQFDYRSFYSLLSSDTHSTVLGNMDNTRLHPKKGLDIRLDAPIYETVRAAHITYTFLLKFLQEINHKQKLKKGNELKLLNATNRFHDKKYKELQEKYDFK